MKFAPAELIQLINLANHLCPMCKVPLSNSHLSLRHSIVVPNLVDLIKTLDHDSKLSIANMKRNRTPIERSEIIKNAGFKVGEYINKIHSFLQIEKFKLKGDKRANS